MYHFPSDFPLFFLLRRSKFLSLHILFITHCFGRAYPGPTLLNKSAFLLMEKNLKFFTSFLLQTQPWDSKSLLDLKGPCKLHLCVLMSLGQGKRQGGFLIMTQSALLRRQASLFTLFISLSSLDLSPCLPFPLMSLCGKRFWEGGPGFLSAQRHTSLLPSCVSSLLGKSHGASSYMGIPSAADLMSGFLPEAVYKGDPKEGAVKLFIDFWWLM